MKIKLLGMLMFGCILLSGLASEVKASSFQNPFQPTSITIKGLSLGMDIDTACSVFKKLFNNDSLEVTAIVTGDSDKAYKVEVLTSYGAHTKAAVMADTNRKLTLIVLSPIAIDELFDAQGVSGQEFAEQLIEAYQLVGGMQPWTNSTDPLQETDMDVYGWKFKGVGYSIVVDTTKTLILSKEKKLSFN